MTRPFTIVALAALILTGCGKSESGSSASKPLIGFIQFAKTPSLDNCHTGFIDALKKGGYEDGVNCSISYQNANGDISALNLMANKMKDDGAVLVGTAGTPALQASLRAMKQTPICFSAVIDPVAAGASSGPGKVLPNVTGVMNPFPIADGIRMVKEIMPNVRVIGSLYDTSEPFAPKQEQIAKDTCRELGLQWVSVTVSSPADIVPGVQALKSKGVQAMVQLPSNTMNQAVEAQVEAGRKAKLPMFSLQTDQIKLGVIAATGIDFIKAGEANGEMAVEILKGKKPSDFPIEQAAIEPIAINEDAARKAGIDIPASVRDKAAKP